MVSFIKFDNFGLCLTSYSSLYKYSMSADLSDCKFYWVMRSLPKIGGELSLYYFKVLLSTKWSLTCKIILVCGEVRWGILCSPNMNSFFFVLKLGRKEFLVEHIVLYQIIIEKSLTWQFEVRDSLPLNYQQRQ